MLVVLYLLVFPSASPWLLWKRVRLVKLKNWKKKRSNSLIISRSINQRSSQCQSINPLMNQSVNQPININYYFDMYLRTFSPVLLDVSITFLALVSGKSGLVSEVMKANQWKCDKYKEKHRRKYLDYWILLVHSNSNKESGPYVRLKKMSVVVNISQELTSDTECINLDYKGIKSSKTHFGRNPLRCPW